MQINKLQLNQFRSRQRTSFELGTVNARRTVGLGAERPRRERGPILKAYCQVVIRSVIFAPESSLEVRIGCSPIKGNFPDYPHEHRNDCLGETRVTSFPGTSLGRIVDLTGGTTSPLRLQRFRRFAGGVVQGKL
jgi:hypothetical protein